MVTIVMRGTLDHAPVFLPGSGAAPAWSGKSFEQLTEQDLEDIARFATEGARELGVEDFLNGRPTMANPFHRGFLFGEPRAMFEESYRLGQVQAASSWSAPWEVAHGYQPAAVPV